MGELADHDVARLRADNPSPYTLDGTNTWVVGRDPAWVVDPGPLLAAHVDAVSAEVERRGGAGGIALTHDHADHSEAVPALRERLGGAPVAAVAYDGADLRLGDGERFGPFEVVALPGHADDHVALVAGPLCFTGDAVLGEGSVFVTSRLGEYLAALERLRERRLAVLCPGHGPPVGDPEAKLAEYIAHRAEREAKLLAALDAGLRSEDELLDAAWADAPAALRPAAALTLRAHLEKLRDEGRAPQGV
jgi:glyoxylase-like metal-dependent hydrolase (beta-lactamase superfamily II)